MSRITNEQREAIVRDAVAKRDALLASTQPGSVRLQGAMQPQGALSDGETARSAPSYGERDSHPESEFVVSSEPLSADGEWVEKAMELAGEMAYRFKARYKPEREWWQVDKEKPYKDSKEALRAHLRTVQTPSPAAGVPREARMLTEEEATEGTTVLTLGPLMRHLVEHAQRKFCEVNGIALRTSSEPTEGDAR